MAAGCVLGLTSLPEPSSRTARFMMAINACLVHVVEGDSGSGDEEEELSMQDTPIIAGLLEVLVILWEGARESLAKVGCSQEELAWLVNDQVQEGVYTVSTLVCCQCATLITHCSLYSRAAEQQASPLQAGGYFLLQCATLLQCLH